MKSALAVAAKRIGKTVIITMDVGKSCACGKPVIMKITNGEIKEFCSAGSKCSKQ